MRRWLAGVLRRMADRLEPEPRYETPEWMKKPPLPLDAGTVLHIPRFDRISTREANHD